MKNYRLDRNKRGRLIKIVEDVEIPLDDLRIQRMEAMTGHAPHITGKTLIARFVNEELAKEFLDAYFFYHKYKGVIDAKPI